jgi:hypothetical protein
MALFTPASAFPNLRMVETAKTRATISQVREGLVKI